MTNGPFWTRKWRILWHNSRSAQLWHNSGKWRNSGKMAQLWISPKNFFKILQNEKMLLVFEKKIHLGQFDLFSI